VASALPERSTDAVAREQFENLLRHYERSID